MDSILRKCFILFAGFMLVLTLSGCGGSDSTDDADDGGATPTADSSQNSSTVSNTLTASLQSSSGQAADQSESAVTLVKEAVKKNIAAKTSGTLDQSFTADCTDSGTIDMELTGSYTIDDVTYELTVDAEVTSTFDACTESSTITTSDNLTCSFTAALDGDFVCSLAGSYTEEDGIDFDFSCSTDSACSGITVTINGTDHTVGMDDLGATMTSDDDEPTFTGTICVDGTEYDFEDILELEDYEYTELVCE